MNLSCISLSLSTLWGCTLLSSLSSSAGNQASFSFLSRVTPHALFSVTQYCDVCHDDLAHLSSATNGIHKMDIPIRRTMMMYTHQGQNFCTELPVAASQACDEKQLTRVLSIINCLLNSKYLIGEVAKDHLCEE